VPTTTIPDDTLIRQIVDTLQTLAGPHPGFRPVHAKGIVCSGTFRPSAEAAGISRAPHFAGAPVPATIRFANSSGNPEVPDGAPGVRSMAVKFLLPGIPRSSSSSSGPSCRIRRRESPTRRRCLASWPATPPPRPSSGAS